MIETPDQSVSAQESPPTPGVDRPSPRRPPVLTLIAASSAVLFLSLTRPLFMGRVFVYNDLSWFHLPMRYLYQRALVSGDTLLWTPAILSGFYLLGEGQIGLFHPLHLLLYALLPLWLAFNLEMLATAPAAFAGTYWFLRRLGFGVEAALFGAMLFAFAGFNLLHFHHINMVAVVAHLPWLLATADMLIVEDSPRRRAIAFAGLALTLASAILLGFPQGVWWNSLALTAFSIFRAGETGRWRTLLTCAAAFGVGVLLGGVQLLPSVDAALHSQRNGIPREFALTYSMHPSNLIQLWSPYFFEQGAFTNTDFLWLHELGIYSGAILPVALIWVWMRRRALRERRRLITAATVFAALTLVLALGSYGRLDVLLTYLPVLGSLRAPVRYIVLTQFALMVLAAILIEDLVAIAERRSAPTTGTMTALWIPAGLSAATTFMLAARLARPYTNHIAASVPTTMIGLAFVTVVTVLVFRAGRGSRGALAALVLVTMADLGMWGVRFIYREKPKTITSLIQGVLPAPGEPADSYAAATADGPYRSDLLVMRGYRLTTGYVGLYPASRYPLEGDIAGRLSGTRWRFTLDGRRYPEKDSVARIRLLTEDGRDATGQANLAVDRPGHLVAHVEAPERRILALTERFHPGWSATSDGRPVPTVPVEGDFLGCIVDAGVHRVEFEFMPRSFVYGVLMSAAGAVALVAGFVAIRRRRA